MAYAIAILLSVALFSGFIALTQFESARGIRVFGSVRNKLDRGTSRAAFVFQHVDWGAFANHLMRAGAARVAHDIAHATLVVVRVMERTLTRIVKYLRSRHQEEAAKPEERKRFSMKNMVSQMRTPKAQERPQTFDIDS